MWRAGILHKGQYEDYVLQVLHVEMSKSELHTTVDTRRPTIQLKSVKFCQDYLNSVVYWHTHTYNFVTTI